MKHDYEAKLIEKITNFIAWSMENVVNYGKNGRKLRFYVISELQ